uniref:peptidoglycan editing factor PgeF n=1 Tax=uncultured Draconibacterium sp. TaxID=1573823 RepID=UPI003217182C
MDNNTHLIHYKVFEPFTTILAFTTTRLTLDIENVRFSNNSGNRAKLAKAINVDAEKLVFPKQTHTSCVAEIHSLNENTIDQTDALVSNKPGICLCIQTADCVPVLLFDPVKQIVAAIHAGWRGTVGKIVQNTVERMIQNYNSLPENILAAIGPSISPEIYEVGDEVVEAAKKTIPNAETALHKNHSGNYHFNLWEANRQLLLQKGIPEKNIEIKEECTFTEKTKYYSARRDGINTGRMVSGIMFY